MIALLLSRDLMFQPKIARVVEGKGHRLIAASSLPGLFAKSDLTEPIKWIFIDLGLPGLVVQSTIDELRSKMSDVIIVAYGAHVHAERLHDARAAGCDHVLTRGQLEASLMGLLS